MLHTHRVKVSYTGCYVERHLQPAAQWRRLMRTLANEPAEAPQWSELQAERADARAILLEAETLEDARVITEVGIDSSLPGQIVLAVLSAHAEFAILPDLVAFQDSLVIWTSMAMFVVERGA